MGLRHAAGAYARERWAAGIALSQVARELGLPWQTLRLWAEEGGAVVLRPVVVDDTEGQRPASATLALITPSGYRVEGLEARTLVELLRALG
jgi:predicted transcriptional regulator